jgi:c-di-GMP-binding flagellar brake protein YcgR
MTDGVERRLYPRIPLKDVLVDTHPTFDRSHDMLVGKIEDISLGGLLTSFNPFDQLCEEVYLSFSLPDGSSFVGIKSRVVWSGIEEHKQLAGMEFLQFEPEEHKRLNNFLSLWETHFEKHGEYPQ